MTKVDNDSTDPTSFGKWLQEQRVKKNVSLEEIAAVTKVHITQLKNIEEGDLQKLPAPAFVRGFLISYARHLGLNEDEVLSRFKDEQPLPSAGGPLGKSLRAAQSASQPKVRLVENATVGQAPATKNLEKPKPQMLKSQNILIAVGVIAVFVFVGMLISLGKRAKKSKAKTPVVATATDSSSATTTAPPAAVAPSTKENAASTTPLALAPSKPEALTPPPESAKVAQTPVAAPTESGATNGKKFVLELHPIEQSWVNIRIDDKDSSGMILAPGNTYTFDAERKVLLSLSDAGSVEIRWNGTWYAPPGFRGDVKSLSLPEQLGKLTPRALAKTGSRFKKKPGAAAGAAPTEAPATASPAPPAEAPPSGPTE